MSPVAKPGQTREVKATGSDRRVKIDIADERITVAWLCGGSRSFTVDELRKAINYVDGVGSKHTLWFNLNDSERRPYWVRLDRKTKRLTANDRLGDNGFVPWTTLKRSLQAAIAEIHAPPQTS